MLIAQLWNQATSNELHPSNAPPAMDASDAGKETSRSAEAPLKACTPIELSPSLKVTSTNDKQLEQQASGK